jgi:hypothetical protein
MDTDGLILEHAGIPVKYRQNHKNEDRTKIITRTIVKSFLPGDEPETSSRGPGCLYMNRNRTKMVIGKLTKIKYIIERTVRTDRAFSPRTERDT